jgi:hypothetical protein
MGLVFTLLFIFQVKHVLADYFLQGRYMLGKFKPFPDYILPLMAHVAVHAGFTFLIGLAFGCHWLDASRLAIIDLTVHFIMDRIKASPKLLGRYKALSKPEYLLSMFNNDSKAMKSNTYFWWALGFDQFIHHLTHYYIIWSLVQ